MPVNQEDYDEIIARLERLERFVGLRPPEPLPPSGWDRYGRYWGNWEDIYPRRYKEWPEEWNTEPE